MTEVDINGTKIDFIIMSSDFVGYMYPEENIKE